MSKTLNENKSVIFEQATPNEAADIAIRLTTELTGDVQSKDLEDIQSILNDEVFGKTYEDNNCLLNKVMSYFKTSNAKAGSSVMTLALITPQDYLPKKGLLDSITGSFEKGEPQFEDIKSKLIASINKELNGFCKTNRPSADTGNNTKKKINW
jgi:hypothetical protein